jgi:hypothetical protein
MAQCHLHHLYSHRLYSVSYFVDGIDLDARLMEVVVVDGAGEVTEGEIAVIVIVAAAAVAAGDSVHRRGNLAYAAGQNWLGWAVVPNFVSCGGSGGPERDNPVR